jgi:ribonuclease BN (tRNA processing enzyme)
VLGSGGPRINADRASTSYLVWQGGASRVLIDAGGGAFLRFGEAGGKLDQLSLIAITHLHPDHVSDLPALLWRGDQTRHDPLPIAGPSGNEAAPAFDTFLHRLFDAKEGAFQVLGGSLPGGKPTGDNGVPLAITVVDTTKPEPTIVFDKRNSASAPDAQLRVSALGVPHANMPSLAYRIDSGGKSIVFGSDQTGENPRFATFARRADVLVLHMSLAVGVTSPFHATPAVVGRLARDAEARHLIVSHLGAFDIAAAVAEVKKVYAGPVTIAEDLQCTPAPAVP